jgi:hypothetical protein
MVALRRRRHPYLRSPLPSGVSRRARGSAGPGRPSGTTVGRVTGATTHPSGVRVVGSASSWVHRQVTGPTRTGRVIHAGPDAVYVDLGGSCLGLLSAAAVRVPCGVRTELAALPSATVGAPASVANGRLVVEGCEALVGRIVDTSLPAVDAPAAAWGGAHLGELAGDRLADTRERLPAAALVQLAEGLPGAVRALLGLGPGLTPLGDDVLAGWLATAAVTGHPARTAIHDAVRVSAHARTTLLSATLLACAARGEGVPELRALLSGIVARSPEAVARSLAPLVSIGHDSGRGILLGALLALPGSRTEP